ncbi:MAG: fasciclin domain-containing protein [Culturomica sp.]|jgi:uncharacterized surface protein with fasciclin (FAS1) repeats|nr:fasciclin domain-containing protein [Culturomica sp.]
MQRHPIYATVTCLFLLFLGLFPFSGCDDNFSDRRFDENTEEMQIYDWVRIRPEFSLYKEISDYSGFYSTLSTAGSYTAFIPTNEAFERLFARLRIDGFEEMSPEYWLYYMKYHTLEAKINTNSFQGGEMSEHTMMGTDYFLTVDITDFTALKLNNTAVIVDTLSNVETRNGYINVLTEVLAAPVETVYDLLQANGGYTIMLRLFEEYGFLPYLKDSLVTVLVEPDRVFQNADPAIALNPDTISNLREWLSYHIIPGERSFLNQLDGRCIQTLYEKDVTTFNFDNGKIRFYVNQKDYLSSMNDYPVNANALNGVYHSMGVPLRIRLHTPGIIRYNLYGRTNTRKGYTLNVFAEAPAFVSENVGGASFHQGINQPEPPICMFNTTQVGDAFNIYIPDVVPGIYQVRMIYNNSVCSNLTMYHEGSVVTENINMTTPVVDFPEYTVLKMRDCGKIEMLQMDTVRLRYQVLESKNLVMDIIELIPDVSISPVY